MNTQNRYIPVSNCLALTVKKDHRLVVAKKAATVTFRVLWKAVLYAFILTIATVII